MNSALTIEMPVFTELLSEIRTQNKELAEIKALLKVDKYDEREFITANQFCTRNSISRKTLDKRVKEGKIEVNDSLGVKRYRKATP